MNYEQLLSATWFQAPAPAGWDTEWYSLIGKYIKYFHWCVEHHLDTKGAAEWVSWARRMSSL